MKNKSNVLLLTPYSSHGVARGFRESLSSSNYRIIELNFQEIPDICTQKFNSNVRSYLSGLSLCRESTEMSDSESSKCIIEINKLVKKHKSQLIIPTKEKYVLFLAQNRDLFSEKLFIPSREVIELYQSKLETFNFLKHQDPLFPVALTSVVNSENIFELLLDGPKFIKPQVGSGGKNSALISNLEEFNSNFGGLELDLIACEPLIHPEFNHTLFIKGGEIVESGTYMALDNNLGASTSQEVVQISEIEDISKELVKHTRNFSSQIDGCYNIDFLRDNSGNLKLTEVNVGRLPGGHEIFKTVGKNFAKLYVEIGKSN